MRHHIKRGSACPLTALCFYLGLQLSNAAVQAQEVTELPLTGPAFLIADAAYKAYAVGNYSLAIERAREAVRLRPDLSSLKKLLANAESALAAKTQPDVTPRATASANRTPPNRQQRGATVPPVQPALPPTDLVVSQPIDASIALAFTAAEQSYKAYDLRDFTLAARQALEAVRMQPANQDYRLLLIASLTAAGKYPEARQALADAGSLARDDSIFAEKLAAQNTQLGRTQAQSFGAMAYANFEKGNFAAAASDSSEALRLAPTNVDLHALLVNALYRSGQYALAEDAATLALQLPIDTRTPAALQAKAALLAQRGFIRQKLGRETLARQDFEAALGSGQLPASTEIGLLGDLGRDADAATRFEAALQNNELKSLSDADVAYLAVRAGKDDQALEAFNRSSAAGLLANTAYQDAAFAALRARQDDQAIGYFKRAIDDANSLKLRMEPQLLFNARRSVAEVSRQGGFIASLSYRGAVSGVGLAQGGTTDSVQGGIEGYWRPWGYQNGQYTELFARAFQTLYSDGGTSGGTTLQTAVGIRYKPLAAHNLVVSLSRVISPSGGRNDWLAQLGYSDDVGTDLRVDTTSWPTRRAFLEVGRYFSAGQSYALGEFQAGKSFRVGDGETEGSGRWVLFPHLSIAADYDSGALESSAMGLGPGLTARYWFREDIYAAPRSYMDISLHYRGRLSGAQRAKGVFLTTTVSY